MNITDMIILGFNNLRQRKLRTFLTTLGVIVGIGALSSMISFGTGLQKNISDAFAENDMFTSMRITAKKINLGDPKSIADSLTPISDSIMVQLKAIDELEVVFPDLIFSGKIILGLNEWTTNVSGIPSEMGAYPPFSNLLAGKFYHSDTVNTAIISIHALKQLGILIKEDPTSYELINDSTANHYTLLPSDSIIGKEIKIKTAVLNPKAISFGAIFNQSGILPLKDTITNTTISGIFTVNSAFTGGIIKSGLILPFDYANSIPRINIDNVSDFLNGKGSAHSFQSIYGRASDVLSLEIAKKKIKALGLEVFTMGEQLAEIKRAFLIIDTVLGAIGLIALFVASLGIINTMVMSILERTREIGIMKAIGASNLEIKLIFFVEASVIGFFGGVFGLVLGWFVTRLANLIMNSQLRPLGEAQVDLFYFPMWLIIGSLLFSIFVSLLAGLYPAIRASRVDPLKALRHD